MSTVLVTGGTGLLGRRVAHRLAAAGNTVLILSRRAVVPPVSGAEVTVGGLRTGWGLHQAVAAATAIVHCATDPRDFRAVDVDGTNRLLGSRAPCRPSGVGSPTACRGWPAQRTVGLKLIRWLGRVR